MSERVVLLSQSLLATGMSGDLLKEGELLKLGGRKKDKWERRHVKVTTDGMIWCAGSRGVSER